jgi:hypothetical protein
VENPRGLRLPKGRRALGQHVGNDPKAPLHHRRSEKGPSGDPSRREAAGVLPVAPAARGQRVAGPWVQIIGAGSCSAV